MFQIKYKDIGLNCEKRDVTNLSNRVFLCRDVRSSEIYDKFDVKIDKNSARKDNQQDTNIHEFHEKLINIKFIKNIHNKCITIMNNG